MSNSSRIQLVLGACAAIAAYLALVVYNGGHVDLTRIGLSQQAKAPAAGTQAAAPKR